jgi:hypothetical protein
MQRAVGPIHANPHQARSTVKLRKFPMLQVSGKGIKLSTIGRTPTLVRNR